MLTFRFTGASGEMTEEELLTAGMESKTVRLEFSPEWDGLRKAVVFSAGCKSCTIVDAEETETIPAQMLSESLQRLYVGAYGLSEDGMVVIPAIYATGPFIQIGTDASGENSVYYPGDPFWLELEDAVEKTLRFTPQALSEAQKKQSRQNIGAAEEDPEAAQLLCTLLKNAAYSTDQTANLLYLEAALCHRTVCSVSVVADKVTVDNLTTLLLSGDSYQATLTAQTGYELASVTVVMDGVDITDSVYSGGTVSIPGLTGDVVITATAKAKAALTVDRIAQGTVTYSSNGGLYINATTPLQATLLPVGQYLNVGESYRMGIRLSPNLYTYNIQVMLAAKAGATFPYVAGTTASYSNVTARVKTTSWVQTNMTYTADRNNLILSINFRRVDGAPMTQEDYDILQSAFFIETL